PDTLFVLVTGRDLLGCQNQATIRVIGAEKPVLTVASDSVCEGNVLTFNGSPQNISKLTPYQPFVFWTNNQNDTLVKNYILETSSSGDYKFFMKIGECEASKTVTANFNSFPLLDLKNFLKFCSDSASSIILDAGLGSLNANDSLTMKYLWSTGQTTRRIRIADEGIYKVSVTNKSNCTTTDSIRVVDRCPPLIFIPDAFTPTVKGANERAFVKGKHYTNFSITIFNRWGEVVFYSDDKNESWDGTYRGEPVPVGVYPYIVNYEGVHEEYRGPYSQRGRVLVIK
ncbi:MAG: gliding motility-associated C-terminal domain-containing protein, partial [Cytophagales bacterium]